VRGLSTTHEQCRIAGSPSELGVKLTWVRNWGSHVRWHQPNRARWLALLYCAAAVIAALVLVLATPGGSAHQHVRHHYAARQGARYGGLSLQQSMARGNAWIRRTAQLGLPIWCAGHHGNAVAFTFDDGPGPYTDLALKKLREAHERATFFVVGRSMNAWPGKLPSELKLGAIGDHTYTHPFLPGLTPGEIEFELQETKLMIQAQSGEPVDMFRPPYGAINSAVEAIAKRLGLLGIMWTQDSRDSLGANWAQIIKNVENGLHPGEIILFHENHGQTIRALTTLLPLLHRRHLRSVSLPELFATDPPPVSLIRRGFYGCFPSGKIPGPVGGIGTG
jgi:peptidoglycan/xylan/chitin deacetylase (PgdA/CDA1 family)